MKTQLSRTMGMVDQGQVNACDGVRYFLRTPLMVVIQCLLIFELTPSVQAQTPEDPNPDSFDYSITNGTITITRYTGTGGNVTIPSMIDDLPVTNIGPRAFQFRESVISVAIPESVTNIREEAFSVCTGLTHVTVPDSVASIGERAFDHCTGLKSVIIGNSVTSIGGSAFAWCSGLTTVTIPNSVTNIGDGAFSYCSPSPRFQITGLTTVTIGDSVTSLGVDAFFGCANLAGVYFRGNPPGLAGPAFSDTAASVYYLPGTTGWDATLAGRPTAMWIPVIPSLDSVTTDNALRLATHSPAPAFVRVQRSVNLRDWEERQTVTREGGPSELQDDDAATRPYRFYRGIEE